MSGAPIFLGERSLRLIQRRREARSSCREGLRRLGGFGLPQAGIQDAGIEDGREIARPLNCRGRLTLISGLDYFLFPQDFVFFAPRFCPRPIFLAVAALALE